MALTPLWDLARLESVLQLILEIRGCQGADPSIVIFQKKSSGFYYYLMQTI